MRRPLPRTSWERGESRRVAQGGRAASAPAGFTARRPPSAALLGSFAPALTLNMASSTTASESGHFPSERSYRASEGSDAVVLARIYAQRVRRGAHPRLHPDGHAAPAARRLHGPVPAHRPHPASDPDLPLHGHPGESGRREDVHLAAGGQRHQRSLLSATRASRRSSPPSSQLNRAPSAAFGEAAGGAMFVRVAGGKPQEG